MKLKFAHETQRLFKKSKKSHPKTVSPGVKGLAGEQGAVVMVADEVRMRSRAVAARRFGQNADLHLVFGVPNVQQEDIVNQDGVGRYHAACYTIETEKGMKTREQSRLGMACVYTHLCRYCRRPGEAGW